MNSYTVEPDEALYEKRSRAHVCAVTYCGVPVTREAGVQNMPVHSRISPCG